MTQPKGTQARRFAAILMADVVGYSRLSSIDESGTVAELFAPHFGAGVDGS
jgi:class 3 adenylate cyclase